MQKRHARKLERYSDQMRVVLDLVGQMMDERLGEEARLEAAYDLMERSSLIEEVREVREVFRSIANARTDGG